MNFFSKKNVVERELIWLFADNSAKSMVIDLAGAKVTWKRADTARAVVHGEEQLIEQVYLKGEHLGTKSGKKRLLPLFCSSELFVELESPAIEQWVVIGSTALYLRNIDQNHLHLKVKGSGDIQAAGKVENVEITIIGSGEIDTGLLLQKNAVVEITGHGDVVIAPTGLANVKTDRGDIKLLSKPQETIYSKK